MREGQWYPGNMARAINNLRQDLKVIDLVVELLDARIPSSSRNPMFARLLGDKKHLLLLHKADRAEEAATGRWLSFFKRQGKRAMPFSIYTKSSINYLLRFLKQEERGMRSSRLKRPLRMMFIGIPNVGKSTLINYFVKKAVTRTGNRPGITRGRQWIRIMPNLELLDTPGILWPKLTEETSYPLAAVGAIPAGRIDLQNIAIWLIERYLERGKEQFLFQRYQGLPAGEAEYMLEQIGVSQGCLQSAGKVDLERAAALLLRDFQDGLLDRITLENPPVVET